MTIYDKTTRLTTPLELLQKVQAILPNPEVGSLTLGEQFEQGIVPTGFDGTNVGHCTHLNTGLFIPDSGGGWVARGSNVTVTWCLVLDDVGTKVGVPSVEPTFIIETNPATGSQQWVYVYNCLVEKGWGAAMATAAADAGISDEFIAHRYQHWFRTPQSLPPAKRQERIDTAAKLGIEPDLRPAQLVLWTGKTFGFAELAEAFGITPLYENIESYDGTQEYDPETGEQDPVLKWMTANGWVKRGRPDRNGFRDVRCANAESHSDPRRPWMRYVPPNAESRGAALCHHSGCPDIKLKQLREAVAAAGGPSVLEAQTHARRVEPFDVPECMPPVSEVPLWDGLLTGPVVQEVLPPLPITQGDVAREMLRGLVNADPIATEEGLDSVADATGQSKTVLRRTLAALKREVGQAREPREQVMEIVADLQMVNGSVVPNATNVVIELARNDYDGCFAFDTFRNRPVVMKRLPFDDRVTSKHPRPLEDADYLTVRNHMQRMHLGWHKLAKGDVIDGVDRVCQSNLWHPIKDYLEKLEEPPVRGYLDTWLTQFLKAEGDWEYLRQIGRKWLIGAVARVMDPGCQMDNALILEGDQGLGKSSALRILAGDDFFGDSLPDFHDVKASEYIAGKWVIEMAELTGLRRSEVEQMRSFLTRREESFRPAYGRQVMNYKRQCVFAGSTNRDDYLTDPKGERRFWIAKIVGVIDLVGLKDIRDALWWEAYQAYEAGESWHLEGDAAAAAVAMQQSRVDENVLAGHLENILENWNSVCISMCIEKLQLVDGVTLGGTQRQKQMAVAEALKHLGWVKGGRHTIKPYGQVIMWLRYPNAPLESGGYGEV